VWPWRKRRRPAGTARLLADLEAMDRLASPHPAPARERVEAELGPSLAREVDRALGIERRATARRRTRRLAA
jgi:hypothetical protein